MKVKNKEDLYWFTVIQQLIHVCNFSEKEAEKAVKGWIKNIHPDHKNYQLAKPIEDQTFWIYSLKVIHNNDKYWNNHSHHKETFIELFKKAWLKENLYELMKINNMLNGPWESGKEKSFAWINGKGYEVSSNVYGYKHWLNKHIQEAETYLKDSFNKPPGIVGSKVDQEILNQFENIKTVLTRPNIVNLTNK